MSTEQCQCSASGRGGSSFLKLPRTHNDKSYYRKYLTAVHVFSVLRIFYVQNIKLPHAKIFCSFLCVYAAKLLYELTNYLQLYMMYSSQYHNRRRPINKTVSMIKILTRFIMCSLKSPQFFMLAVQKSSNQKSKLKTQRSECLTEQRANGRFRGIFTEWRRLHMFPL